MHQQEKENRAAKAELTLSKEISHLKDRDHAKSVYHHAEAIYQIVLNYVYASDDHSGIISEMSDSAAFNTNLDTLEKYLTDKGRLPSFSTMRV